MCCSLNILTGRPGGEAPFILDFGSRWLWVINFTSWLLYVNGRKHPYLKGGVWAVERAGRDAVTKKEYRVPQL